MESLQGTVARLKAVKNIGKITKAMEVVSATKMRKSQEVALHARPYAMAALKLLRKITQHNPVETLFSQERPVQKELIILVSSDRGLAGAFNMQTFRAFETYIAQRDSRMPYAVMPIGKKAIKYCEKNSFEIAGVFEGFGDFIDFEEIMPIAEIALRGFIIGEWDKVSTVSTHFRTALRQEVLVRSLLPTRAEAIQQTIDEILPEAGKYTEQANTQHPSDDHGDYLFEPSAQQVAQELVPYLIRTQIYHLMLEANASEHSARRVAMKTASDNAGELSDDLTLAYNKARQAGITKEIIEITSTQNALNG